MWQVFGVYVAICCQSSKHMLPYMAGWECMAQYMVNVWQLYVAIYGHCCHMWCHIWSLSRPRGTLDWTDILLYIDVRHWFWIFANLAFGRSVGFGYRIPELLSKEDVLHPTPTLRIYPLGNSSIFPNICEVFSALVLVVLVQTCAVLLSSCFLR